MTGVDPVYVVWSQAADTILVEGTPEVNENGWLVFTRSDGIKTAMFQYWFAMRLQDRE